MKLTWLAFFITIIGLSIWFAFTEAMLLIWIAIVFSVLVLIVWYFESAISPTEWKVFRIKNKRSGFWFHPKEFSNYEQYFFICENFERTEQETGVHKIVGFSYWHHRRNSLRLGYRRAGNKLNLVLYGYKKAIRFKIDLPVSISEGDCIQVSFKTSGLLLACSVKNITTSELHIEYTDHNIKRGFGYQLYPYGVKSIWKIRK